MSTELERLELQIQRSFEGPAWHGPSVLEALQGLRAEGAQAYPIAGAHSVWELVLPPTFPTPPTRSSSASRSTTCITPVRSRS